MSAWAIGERDIAVGSLRASVGGFSSGGSPLSFWAVGQHNVSIGSATIAVGGFLPVGTPINMLLTIIDETVAIVKLVMYRLPPTQALVIFESDGTIIISPISQH